MNRKALNEWSLGSLIERGGVYYAIPGENPKALIAGIIRCLPSMPAIDTSQLYRGILEREALMSTGIGRGIALPHPRNPIAPAQEDIPSQTSPPLATSPSLVVSPPLVVLAFPEQPIDWNTYDGSTVHTVFLIVSVSTEQHLNTLSRITFLCQQEKFYSLIKERASREDIIAAIREAETSWANKC